MSKTHLHKGVDFEVVSNGNHRPSYHYIINQKASYSEWTSESKCIKAAIARIDQALLIGFGL